MLAVKLLFIPSLLQVLLSLTELFQLVKLSWTDDKSEEQAKDVLV